MILWQRFCVSLKQKEQYWNPNHVANANDTTDTMYFSYFMPPNQALVNNLASKT